MHKLYELREKLLKELKGYADTDLSVNTLPHIDTLAHAVKNLNKVIAECEKESDEDYREFSYGRPNRDGAMFDGGSYRRQKRDAMGRYSRAGMVDHLRDLMEDAPDERTREKLRQMIGELDQ